MLLQAVAPGRYPVDLRAMCEKLTLTAESDEEAEVLSMLYRVIAGIAVQDRNKAVQNLGLWLQPFLPEFKELSHV